MLTLLADIERVPDVQYYGRVTAVQGLLVEVAGIERRLAIGARVRLQARDRRQVECEVVGFRQKRALLMPFASLDGVGLGCKALVAEHQPVVYPDKTWLGRVVNAAGEPLDGGPPLRHGPIAYPLRASPPPPAGRRIKAWQGSSSGSSAIGSRATR